MTRKQIEEKARYIASLTFSNATMRGMLFDLIVSVFCPTPAYPPGYRHPPAPRGDRLEVKGDDKP